MSRRCPSSSSGSSSTRRLAASTAPLASPAAESGGREPFEDVADGPLDADGAGCLPVVEGRAVAEREAGQERAPRQGGGRLEVGRSRPLAASRSSSARSTLEAAPGRARPASAR